ncbi:MAG: hypothetical protein ACKVUS_02245 [Saprospiraceae bacterium]
MAISFDWSETISSLPSQPIPAEWLATHGSGVNVAFIDTGVNLGLGSLKHLDKPGRKFFTGAPGFSVAKLTGQDLVGEAFGTPGLGHGTLYASLLAGKTPNPPDPDKDAVGGIANAANYFIIKARNPNDKKTTIRNLLDALELAANLGAEIAITGQCISASEMPFEGVTQADIDRVFALPGVQRMFIFAPLKNREAGEAWEGITADNFPSMRSEVHNVAKCPDDFDQVADVVRGQPIAYLPAGFDGQLLAKNGDATDMNFSNSGAVVIVGGIAVLALSFFKQQNGGASPSKGQMAQMLGDRFNSLDNALGGIFDKPALFKNL